MHRGATARGAHHAGARTRQNHTACLAAAPMMPRVACGRRSFPLVTSPGFVITNPAAAKVALAWPHAGQGVEFVFAGPKPAPWSEHRTGLGATQ